MSHHSVVEAKNQLSALIERALKGERVVITRHGQPIVEINPVRAPAVRPTGKDAVEWLRKNRAVPALPDLDAVALVSQMRDKDWR
ncbi:MAG: type II toxin-antitoxin system Phd/YefM family antitoxin [Bosea sp. (in: a-proteobacteria)]